MVAPDPSSNAAAAAAGTLGGAGANASAAAAAAGEGDYRVQGKLGEGTFSQVLRMKHRVTGRVLAFKKFKKRFRSIEEVECLREIQALRRVNPHPNLVQLEDILFDPGSGTLYLAFELMDANLYDLISKKGGPAITEPKVKSWFYQIFKGLEFLHSKGVFHRDLKPENILIREGTIVKIADLGSCRGIHSKGPFTEYIATRWYRSPETLLTSGRYNYKMDMWGAGCVLYEVVTKQPLFPGSDAVDQLHRIHRILGSPSDSQLKAILGPKMEGKFTFPSVEGTGLTLAPPYDGECRHLILELLRYTPDERYSATQCLAHSFFSRVDLSDLPETALAVYRGQAPAQPIVVGGQSSSHGRTQQQQPSMPVPVYGTLPPAAAPIAAAVASGYQHSAPTAAYVQQQPHAAAAVADDRLAEGYLQRLMQKRKKDALLAAAGGANASSHGRQPVPAAASKPAVPMLPTLPMPTHHGGMHMHHGMAPAAPTAAAASSYGAPRPGAGGLLPNIGVGGTTVGGAARGYGVPPAAAAAYTGVTLPRVQPTGPGSLGITGAGVGGSGLGGGGGSGVSRSLAPGAAGGGAIGGATYYDMYRHHAYASATGPTAPPAVGGTQDKWHAAGATGHQHSSYTGNGTGAGAGATDERRQRQGYGQ